LSNIEQVYLIGLGAIGGAFAERIHINCPGCLKIVADAERRSRYAREGFRINGHKVSFQYISPDDVEKKADLIIIAVKYHHLNQAIKDIRNMVGPDTIILSLLNGISSEEVIGKEYGMEKMLYSFCVGTDAVRVGTEINYTKIGKIVFGDSHDSGFSEKVTAVRNFFDRAEIPYTIPENILRELWWKFMMNVGINQVSAILRAPYKFFTSEGHALDLMRAASREVIDISRKAGINLNENDLEECIRILKGLSPLGKTSMLQDVEAGRKTEVEIFSGTVVELGRKYGIMTPVNDVLYKIIKAMEEVSPQCVKNVEKMS